MGKKQSLRTKATNFVSVLLNPISDSDTHNHKPSKNPSPSPPSEEVGESKTSESETTDEEGSHDLVDEPDTSSFTAFLYSLLSSSDSGDNAKPHGKDDDKAASDYPLPDSSLKENSGKKSLFSRSKQSLGRAIRQAARIGGFRYQDRKDNFEMKFDDGHGSKISGVHHIEPVEESVRTMPLVDVPEISEPSVFLSDSLRSVLYASLPPLMQGRKWMLLYSTWRHGISLSTLYRRSMLWPGLSLLVVGDRKGAVFGSLVEAPLRPSNKRKYQGTNNTFVFTNTSGHPVIYRPTGVNRYFTLCNTDFLAIGGGGHFALYLDGDLLNGSSSTSETYGNPCLANSQDFEVKEVELWGFVYASKYEEVLALSRTELPGICRW
ncbi:oxidation resistance protein 1-like [Gastrolobium bilobum]|uniref:oxidation resistance protein 1-like n=1 Tax=Gastrolobium bilobum TaxID=150636 RepID=UPI002AB04508|nr:oxidation resistance protein 1-like [Gastrolobium bilobum]